MSDDLCIMLLTYNRLEYAKTTLSSIGKNIKYTRGDKHLHIASDGDSDEYIATLSKLWDNKGLRVTTSNSHRGGYGASYNIATQTVHQLGVKYVLPLEDDWECIKPLDADHFTRVLDSGSIGCIRLGYLGYTQELRGSMVFEDGAHFLDLSPDSPEPHVFAGHPRIETVSWERSVGPWPEKIGAGATEFVVAHEESARQGVAWPMEVDPRQGYGIFAHIGTEKAEDVSGR